MKLERCVNGHIFDISVHKNCPYCNEEVGNKDIEKSTLILKSDDKTLAYLLKENNISPVVGWLIAISGSEKGKDYRIINERNFIGRSENMHIVLGNDINVARKNHCSISYLPKQRIFMLSPGEGSGLVYLQGVALYESKQIFNMDIIEIGENRYIFVALCGDKFDWNM